MKQGLAALPSAAMLALAVVASPGLKAGAPAAQARSDKHAIEVINARWLRLIRAKDASAVARLYAATGAVMPPNAPIATGRSAVAKTWASMMATPGFALTFAPDEIIVSASGDLAYDRGTYRLSAKPPSGAINDDGKYVVVWRKIGRQWQVAADIFNSNRPR